MLDVGDDVDRHEVAEAVQPPPLAPVHEPADRAIIGLAGVGVADSLALTRLGMALETEFGCTVLDDDAELIETVGGMVTYIEGRLAA